MEPAPRFPTVAALSGVPFLREDRLVTHSVVISGTGLWTPEQSITNEELVASFNEYVARYNERHADAIEAGDMEPLTGSNSAFIEKASGIKQRYVLDKEGILDPDRLAPNIPERSDDELSVQAEIAYQEMLPNADALRKLWEEQQPAGGTAAWLGGSTTVTPPPGPPGFPSGTSPKHVAFLRG